MNKPSFFEGVTVAFLGAIGSSAAMLVFVQLGTSPTLFILLLSTAAFAYIAYLLVRSGEKTGRVTVAAIFIGLCCLSWLWTPSVPVYAMIVLTLIWLIRSLYYYSSVLAALADMGLTGMSLVVGLWAWFNTESVFLASWSFLLTQALFVFIPSRIPNRAYKNRAHAASPSSEHTTVPDPFEHAYRCAETALRKLANH
ncbi:MAG: hypothetical protein OEZ68_04385 [Gammaproteobacteria bacterium]|nr:hypothetical protein [Gammaproteobacteria bacterium]MDH5800026.1 hypothetical protein [Gammaproteobacteria bacterium]